MLTGEGKGGGEPNHSTARKPGPLQSIITVCGVLCEKDTLVKARIDRKMLRKTRGTENIKEGSTWRDNERVRMKWRKRERQRKT